MAVCIAVALAGRQSGGACTVKIAALKAPLAQPSICVLQTVSSYPAMQRQQPSASTRQDSWSRDDKFVAVQDVL